MTPRARSAVGADRGRAGVHLWGPLWLPAAKFVGRVWGPVQGGAEVEATSGGGAGKGWISFDSCPGYASMLFEPTDTWEIGVSQVSEVEPLVRAISRRWAMARDEDSLDEPDEVGYRARYLTVVGPSGSVIDVRFVTEAMSQARRSAVKVYGRWANKPRISGEELASLKEDLLGVREGFDSAAAASASLPADMSVESLTRAASRLADLWGWEREQANPLEDGNAGLPVGERVIEGPARPSPVGIGELLFFGRPIADWRSADTGSDRQLLLPLSPVKRGERTDPEWERLFQGLADGSVGAVMEDVSVRSLVYHNRRYRPKDRRTALSVARNLRLIASGERPWLRVRRALGRRGYPFRASSYVVSQDYPLFKAYKDSGVRFARCLILTEDRPE